MTAPSDYEILAAIGDHKHLQVLLAVAAPLARARKGRVVPLYVSSDQSLPDWFVIPEELTDVVGPPQTISGPTVGAAALDYVDQHKPDLLLLFWRGKPSRGRYLLGRTLDPLIQYAHCDVAVVRVKGDAGEFVQRMADLRHITVPVGGGPNAQLALDLALDLSEQAEVTALRVAQASLGAAAAEAQHQILAGAIQQAHAPKRLVARIEPAAGVVQGIRQATENDCDLLFVGATRDSLVDRLLFGNLPQQIVSAVATPTIIVRRHDASPAGVWRRMVWRVVNLLPQLTNAERSTIYRRGRSNARGDADFYLLMVLAAGIASLGLLLNSPAVIIGAMLVAPLMSALIGAGLAIVQGDGWLLRTSLRTVLLGVIVVLLVSVTIGLLVPGSRLTAEMLSRSTPSLLDLFVALISGAAAAYAHARRDAASALPGVAIAVALVPPMSTVGLALTEGRFDIALGALLLFLVNLAAIVSAASLTFLWIGFHPDTGQEKRVRVFRGGVLGTVILLLAITALLAVLAVRSIRASQHHHVAERVLIEQLDTLLPDARVAAWSIAETAEATHISVTIAADSLPDREQAAQLQQSLARALNRPIALDVLLAPALHVPAQPPDGAVDAVVP
ncbi:MAG: DUF389 domain-containing protein [Chloroflexi bacterium]|nr:DUF389 domain-containing protein [Chloroflexota bacterium]